MTLTDADTVLPTVVDQITCPVRVAPVVLALACIPDFEDPEYCPGKTRPNPDVGVTVTHDGAEVSVHAVFEVT